jgi:pentafunctional AROM polypeptide
MAIPAMAEHVPTAAAGEDTLIGPRSSALNGVAQDADDRALDFFIFGSPVTLSPSPVLHQVGFSENGSRHRYRCFDSPSVDEILKQLREDTCGGGSVTIPHKETLMQHVDEVSHTARVIGCINTITKTADGKLFGDNTDWLGIKNQLEFRMSMRGKGEAGGAGGAASSRTLTCLLCGAGGTARAAAYALKEMGASRVMIYNRSKDRAAQLAAEFGFEVTDLDALSTLESLDIIVDTLPGSTGFELPVAEVLERCRPLVLEAAYIPRQTAFVKQALKAGCDVIEGLEMLFAQGCEQCQIWTERPAPRAKIAKALLEALFTEGSGHPAHSKMEPLSVLPSSLVLEAGPLYSGRRGSLSSCSTSATSSE